jgi:hypothetical protein
VRIGFRKLRRIRRAQLDDLSVNSQAHKTFSPGLFDHIAKFSGLVGHKRREKHELCAFGRGKNRIRDLLRRLTDHRFAGGWIMGTPDGCVQESQIIINFRRRCYR